MAAMAFTFFHLKAPSREKGAGNSTTATRFHAKPKSPFAKGKNEI